MADMGVHNAMVSDFDALVGDVLRVLYFDFCEQIRVWTYHLIGMVSIYATTHFIAITLLNYLYMN